MRFKKKTPIPRTLNFSLKKAILRSSLRESCDIGFSRENERGILTTGSEFSYSTVRLVER